MYVLIGLFSFILVINGKLLWNNTFLSLYSIYIVIIEEYFILLIQSLVGLAFTICVNFLIKRRLKKIETLTMTNKSATLTLLVLVIVAVLGNVWESPFFHLNHWVEARLNYNQGNSIVQRIIKFVLPLYVINNLLIRRYSVALIAIALYILMEGSKSAVVTLLGIILFINENSKNFLPTLIPRLVKYVSVSFFLVIVLYMYNDSTFFGMLQDRLEFSEVLPYKKLGMSFQDDVFYSGFLVSPFLIFTSSIGGETYVTWTSAGNWLSTMGNGVDNYEYLLRYWMEGLLAGGYIGIFVLFSIYLLLFLVLDKLYKAHARGSMLPYQWLLYIEFINIVYRGKLANSITTFIFTSIFVIIIYNVFRQVFSSRANSI